MGTHALNLLQVRIIDHAKPRAAEFYLRDGGGLFFRIYPSGLKRACYRFDDAAGRTRRIEHEKPFGGGSGHLTLAEARAWRDQLTELRRRGIDPVALFVAERNAARHAVTMQASARPKPRGRLGAQRMAAVPEHYPPGTFGALAMEFQRRVIGRTYRDPAQFLRLLKCDLLPALGMRPIVALKLAHLQPVFNAITDRGSPIEANRALLAAKKVLRYARTQGHIESNPLADISRRDVGGRETDRERALAFDEIATYWRALQEHAGLSAQVRGCLQLLLLTGQRIGETLAAEWGEFDIDAAIWRIPAEHTKAARAHLVHLPSLAVELLRALPRTGAAVFDDGTGEGPITRRAVTRALDRMFAPRSKDRPALLPLDHFTPHDLRRTMRSRLADLGVLPHVAEKLLNHKLGGVLQVYDRAEYLPEREQAMQAWDTKLRALLALPAPQPASKPAEPEAKRIRAARPSVKTKLPERFA